ncbi:MAG: phenylacetic acid degradation operon negative regulatory protein PaaX [Anaerolineales bacterium]|nr:phenylacetic acid degradation operon negative regulatory protein PaaX [Anaerolineales bacterium]
MSHSQELIFTLYGDYIRHRGGEAWTGSLIELLGLFDLSGQAVRSTLSRMSQKGWLKSRRVSRFSFYSLTPKCINLLEEGARRIFQPRHDPWDGRWHLLIYSIPETKRHLRRKLRKRLLWLGFGTLNHATWISPRDKRADIEQILETFDIHPYVEFFTAGNRDFSSDERIVARCWDLNRLNEYYAALIARYDPLYQQHKARLATGNSLDPQECFIQRFMLIHEYRSSPYLDPNLPLELLPDNWLCERATHLFQQYHELLIEQAEAFVDSVLAKAPRISSQ